MGEKELLLIGVPLVMGIACYVFYVATLSKALKVVDPVNRKMPASNAWLLLIPIFNLYWQFKVSQAIGASFQEQYEVFNQSSVVKPTYIAGIIVGVLQILWVLPLGLADGLLWVALIVSWILHWVYIGHHARRITTLKTDTAENEAGLL